MDRRDFLKLTGKMSAAALMGTLLNHETIAQTVTPEGDAAVQFPVPPSLMLHSDYHQRKLLPELIAALREAGYEGITYQDFLTALRGDGTLPEKPVIISVDDLTMAQGVPAFSAFERYFEIFRDYEFAGVFGINTLPQHPQDDSRWETIAAWPAEAHIEFATHTATHISLARGDISLDTIRAEVIDSAALIRQRTGQVVSALVLPFGAGYDMVTGEILPDIVTVCREGGLDCLVALAGGRVPLDATAQGPYLMGRTGPGVKRGEETVATAMWEVTHWT